VDAALGDLRVAAAMTTTTTREAVMVEHAEAVPAAAPVAAVAEVRPVVAPAAVVLL
jgi:hypothetical protein